MTGTASSHLHNISTIAVRPIRVERAQRPDRPHCVILPALTQPVSERPPVRIFLGTEAAQIRAQRVFFYSVERVRDTSREYRIYLMKDIAGFDRSHWRTGFTNYRFAIPEFAEREGRAIYNDVDQIYLEDPAQLFDHPMGDHGYLAISAKDTSVMLIDCARMAQWWHLEAARHGDKKTLTDTPANTPGLWGALDGGWNTRDDEYGDVQAKVLHYTALHQQPWQPTPRDFSYHPNPIGDLWFELEHAADAAGYGPFRAEVPSPWYAQALDALDHHQAKPFPADSHALELAHTLRVSSLLWCRPPAWQALESPPFPVNRISEVTPAALATALATPGEYDAVAVTGLLEHLPGEDVPWLLTLFARSARKLLYVGLTLSAARGAANTARDNANWWRRQLRTVAQQQPHLAWHLDIHRGEGKSLDATQSALVGARQPGTDPARQPHIWLLLGKHHGDNEQLRQLARHLGWPCQEKPLQFASKPQKKLRMLMRPSPAGLSQESLAQLQPPWPDIVLGTGWRTVNIARWIKAQSGGRTQLMYLGRPRAPLHWFDLIVTTPQYGLPARDNIIHNLLPLNRIDPATLAMQAEQWKGRFAGLPRPWIGVMVGGETLQQHFAVADAIEMAHNASALARREGGALLITTSPRTPPDATRAFIESVDAPHHAYDWRAAQGKDNPYQAYLALCDAFVVSDDSASMIAEAVHTQRPTFLYVLKEITHSAAQQRRLRIAAWMNRRTSQTSRRGTPRQQNWQGRLYDQLFSLGLLRTPRDLKRLGGMLRVRGVVQILDASSSLAGWRPRAPLSDEMAATVAEIRRRAGERHWIVDDRTWDSTKSLPASEPAARATTQRP